MVVGQISIAYTSAYTLIDLGALHLFVSAVFVKKLDVKPIRFDEVCVVYLPLGKNLTS